MNATGRYIGFESEPTMNNEIERHQKGVELLHKGMGIQLKPDSKPIHATICLLCRYLVDDGPDIVKFGHAGIGKALCIKCIGKIQEEMRQIDKAKAKTG